MPGQALGALRDLLQILAGQREHGARGHGARRVLPDGIRVEQRLLAEVRPVGQDPEDRVVPVGAGADLLDLAVGEQEHLVRGAAERGEPLTRRVLPLPAPHRELLEHLLVPVVPQHRQFAELRRDDPHPVSGLHERHASVADRVAEPPVHPVRAALHVHPGQHPQQPPGADLLHLWRGLGGGGQIPRGGCAETLLRPGLLRADLFAYRHGLCLPIKN